MSAAQTFNDHPEVEDAVDMLIDRYGYEGAEGRLLLALSLVRQRRHREGDTA